MKNDFSIDSLACWAECAEKGKTRQKCARRRMPPIRQNPINLIDANNCEHLAHKHSFAQPNGNAVAETIYSIYPLRRINITCKCPTTT